MRSIAWSAALLLLGVGLTVAIPFDESLNQLEKRKVSTTGLCGILGGGATCAGSRFGDCCSVFGICSDSPLLCGAGCLPSFGTCGVPVPKQPVSLNGLCGGGFGGGQTCTGSIWGKCCSKYGTCSSLGASCGTGCQSGYGSCTGVTSSSAKTSSTSTKPSTSTKAPVSSSALSSSKVSSVASSSKVMISSSITKSATLSSATASTISSSITASNATTCRNTPAPTGAVLPNCVPCKGQPGNDKFCGLDINTNYYNSIPITCKVVKYTFDITEVTISPDGIARPAMVVNGAMPGPAIKASWGDTVVVTVNNRLSQNGTSLHFHGVRQLNNNMNDGVPSITQCPIAPGSSMTYTWVAEQYGTSWWHSHFALQTWEGVFGPMIIDGPSSATYDVDLGTLMIQDWTHVTVDSMYDLAENATVNPATNQTFGGPRTMDTGLLNGKNVWVPANSTVSSGSRTEFPSIVAGKSYRLRIINAAIQSTYKVYIDGHTFDVIQSDFVPIKPYSASILNINIGQRYDIIIKASATPGSYWLRADNQEACAHTIQNRDIKALFTYSGFTGVTPTSTGPTYTDECVDEALASLVPVVPLNAGTADITEGPLTIVAAANGASLFKWFLNGATFMSQYNDPTLLEIAEGNAAPTYSGSLLVTLPTIGQWVYLIVETPIPLPHPIHLHGHDFFVLGSGTGTYSASSSLNLVNPPRRDTALLPGAGWMAVAFVTDNPGSWLAHCHIGWHVSMGFALQFLELPDKIVSSGAVNNSCALEANCKSWNTFATANNIIVQDSGV